MVIQFQRGVGMLRSNPLVDVGLTFERHACLFRDTIQGVISKKDESIFEFSNPPSVTIDTLREKHYLIDKIWESPDPGRPDRYTVFIKNTQDSSHRDIFEISKSDYDLLAMAPQRYREHYVHR